HGHQVPGLVVRVGDGPDVRVDFARLGLGETFYGRKILKKRRCDLVHPFVGTLGRQNHGHDQFVRIPVLELRCRCRNCFPKRLHREICSLFSGHQMHLLMNSSCKIGGAERSSDGGSMDGRRSDGELQRRWSGFRGRFSLACAVLLTAALAPTAWAQVGVEILSPSASISILTILPGDEVYSMFGHTA